MTEQETSSDAIVRVEIAIEILNQAQAIVTARVYELEGTDLAAAEALRQRRRDLINTQQSLSADGRDAVEDVMRSGDPVCRTRSVSGWSSDHAEAQASGSLSPERNERVFRNDILPDHMPTTMTPAERPRLMLLGGQPDASKTAVLNATHAELEHSRSG